MPSFASSSSDDEEEDDAGFDYYGFGEEEEEEGAVGPPPPLPPAPQQQQQQLDGRRQQLQQEEEVVIHIDVCKNGVAACITPIPSDGLSQQPQTIPHAPPPPHPKKTQTQVDAFYVTCERIRRPDLIGRPVAVSQFNRGGFVAVSYEGAYVPACAFTPTVDRPPRHQIIQSTHFKNPSP